MDRLRDLQTAAADESLDGLHHRGGQQPQRLFVIQFVAHSSVRDRLHKTGILLPKSRRRFPHSARSPQLHRAGKRPLHTIIPSLVHQAGRS